MSDDNYDARVRRKRVLSISLSVLLICVSGLFAYQHFASMDRVVSDELLANAEDQELQVACELCGAKYTMAAKEYMMQVAAVEGKNRLVCKECGAYGAWRGEMPIEFSREQWKAGFAGQDVLVSDLKAYHAKHPESDQ